MAVDRKVSMKNDGGDRVVIAYESKVDHTYVYHNGKKVYEGGGDRVQDQIDAYMKQGWIVE